MRASILLLLNGVDALTLVRARCLTTRARTAMLASDGEVLMLGAYPFYTRQPTALMDEVFAVNEARVRSCLSDTAVVQRIGSSAIRGMPGIPVVDMLAAQPEWPPSQAQLAALAAAGFEAKGMAPHAADDMWFFGGDGPPGVGHCVLHVVQTINPFVAESRAFVKYVSSHPADFDAYKAVKLEGARLALDGAEGQKLSEYKASKHDICVGVMGRAKAWAAGR